MNIRSLLCSAVAISIFAFSNVSALETSLGIKGGVNLSRFYGADKVDGEDPYKDQVAKPGLVIGAALQLKLASMFAIEPEVLFSQKGQKFSGSDSGGDYSETGYINYIEVPILAQFLIPLQVVTPMLYAGPAFAFKAGRINGKSKYGSESQNMTDEERTAADSSVSGFDFGIAFGGGVEFKAGPGKIVVDIRYTLGLVQVAKLSDEFKAEGMTESDLPKDKNGTLMFAAGYLFKF